MTQVCCVDVDVDEDEDRVHYDGYQVIRALPDSQGQLDTLHIIGEWDQSALTTALWETKWDQVDIHFMS